MSPVIGIKAKNTTAQKTEATSIKKGAPLIIPLKDRAITSMFHNGEKTPPLLVIYADGDKACLTDIFLKQILDPTLAEDFNELEHTGPSLLASSTYHTNSQ